MLPWYHTIGRWVEHKKQNMCYHGSCMNEVTFLEEMVRIPSPSGQESGVAQFVVASMQEQGFDAYEDGVGNVIVTAGIDEGPQVVLLGHIDTVPGNIPVRIEQGLLYGRGSVDAKGSFATFACALVRARKQGTLRCRVVLVGAVEEESASSKGAHYIVDTYAPDYCVIGEPSSWERITLGYKGRLVVHVRREQPSAHSAGEGRAAPEYVVDFWKAVQGYCAQHNHDRTRVFEQLTPSLRTLQSGSDGLYDWVEATIGLRLPEDITPQHVREDVRRLGQDYMPTTDEGVSTVSFEGACPAFRGTRATRLANGFVRGIRAVGGQPGFVYKTGTSDMNVVGPAWQCPIVAYGPGDSRLDHTPNEHIQLDEYHRAITVMTTVLQNIA